jgi:hypothetical protein
MPAPLELGKEFKASEARENVALGLEVIPYTWVHGYRLKALVQEDRSDEVRRLLADQLFKSAGSLEHTLSEIADAIEKYGFPLYGSGAASALRGRDLLLAIASAVRSSSLDGSNELGLCVDRLASKLFVSHRREKTSHIEGWIEALAALLDELLRSRPHLVVDPRSYHSLRLIRSWWGKDSPLSPRALTALSVIAKHLRGAILLLAKMSQRSQGLVEALRVLSPAIVRKAGNSVVNVLLKAVVTEI